MGTSMNESLCLPWIPDAGTKMQCYVCRRCNFFFFFVGFVTDSKLIRSLECQKHIIGAMLYSST